MFKKELLFYILLLINTAVFSQKKYQKSYYKKGQLKEEGWLKEGEKTSFWKYYYRNGTLKKEGYYKDNLEHKYWYFYRINSFLEKEGHFKEGLQNNWWLFYDKAGNISHKCQLRNNQKNGYCLSYKMNKLVKASKYKNGEKIKEWTDFFSFQSENSLNDLTK